MMGPPCACMAALLKGRAYSESQDEIECLCVCPTHKLLIACRCVTVSVGDSVMMGPPFKGACMPGHVSDVKERACHPCFNSDVHVKLNFRVIR